MNKIFLSGNICHDIEIGYTKTNNNPVIKNSIAVRNDFKNAEGKYESEFINFVAWNNQAEFLSKYAKKGSKILIEGRIQTRNYTDKDGKIVYVTEVISDKVELLAPKKEGSISENPFEVPDDELPF